MAGAAVLGRLTWLAAEVAARRTETPRVRTLELDVAGLARAPRRPARRRPAHRRGRLPGPAQLLDRVGARRRRWRSPSSGWTTARSRRTSSTRRASGDRSRCAGRSAATSSGTATEPEPVLLVAGGSGVVPLMAMPRHRARAGATAPMRLLLSSRTLEDVIYREELDRLAAAGDGFDVVHTLTREQPPGWTGYARRIDHDLLAEVAWPASEQPACLRVRLDPLRGRGRGRAPRARLRRRRWIRTERFGATGAEIEIRDLKLDGNAIGGLMLELFGARADRFRLCLRRLRRPRGDGAARRLHRGGHSRPLPPLRGRDDPHRPGPRPNLARPERHSLHPAGSVVLAAVSVAPTMRLSLVREHFGRR